MGKIQLQWMVGIGLCQLFCGSEWAFAQSQITHSIGKVYANQTIQSEKWGTPLYEIHLVEISHGDVQDLKMTYLNADKKEINVQTVTLERGLPKTYTMNQPEQKLQGKLTITDSELIFEKTENGETKTKTMAKPEELVTVGPSIRYVISSHFRELVQGQAVAFQLAFVPRMDSFRVILEKKTARKAKSRAANG